MKLRLALRQEGIWWNAYIAEEHSMENAELIGSILLHPAKQDPKIKEGFILLMQMVMAHGVEAITGHGVAEWEMHPAPESERSGNA